MAVEGLLMPGLLIVTQVIFGKPLKDKEAFRSGDVGHLVESTLGTANHIRSLDKLLEIKWLRAERGAPVRRDNAKAGRPSTTVYFRTPLGKRGYGALKRELAPFGIKLE